MAQIIRRRGDAPARQAEMLDPFRIMREMLRYDPFADLDFAGTAAGGAFIPAFEVKETKDAYVFKADMPGVKDEDLDISLSGNQLVVSGKREEEREEKEGDRYYAYERSYGSFSRSFTLPPGADIDHVKADLKEGVLTLVVGKRPEVQPKRISVGSAGEQKGGGGKAKA
jgi:HSP20 family protein